MKKTFYIAEMQNTQSRRKAQKILAKDFASAKRKATQMQCFHGTTLAIGCAIDSEGYITDVICTKVDGKWC